MHGSEVMETDYAALICTWHTTERGSKYTGWYNRVYKLPWFIKNFKWIKINIMAYIHTQRVIYINWKVDHVLTATHAKMSKGHVKGL